MKSPHQLTALKPTPSMIHGVCVRLSMLPSVFRLCYREASAGVAPGDVTARLRLAAHGGGGGDNSPQHNKLPREGEHTQICPCMKY